jgi:uncharacterized protein involved in response to NO
MRSPASAEGCGHAGLLLVVAGTAWAVAFLGFAAAYSVALWSPRRL